MAEISATSWTVFAVTIAVLLAIDLFAHRGDRAESFRLSVVWSVVWIAAGLAFAGYVGLVGGGRATQDYLAAYLIEKSLSLDNLFVFLVVFRSLDIPRKYQRKVLYWGIFGALVFRAVFVFLGAAALQRWEWVSYVFGALLFVAAIRIFRENPAEEKESRVVRWLSRHLAVTKKLEGPHFFARHQGRLLATPLFVAVCGLELTDIMFAVDSVPAAFSVTRQPFLVYSSNAFAILGLRALYVVLERSLEGLRDLHYGLAGVLAFAALKLGLEGIVEIPAWVSIAVPVVVVGASVWTSLVASGRRRGRSRETSADRRRVRR